MVHFSPLQGQDFQPVDILFTQMQLLPAGVCKQKCTIQRKPQQQYSQTLCQKCCLHFNILHLLVVLWLLSTAHIQLVVGVVSLWLGHIKVKDEIISLWMLNSKHGSAFRRTDSHHCMHITQKSK